MNSRFYREFLQKIVLFSLTVLLSACGGGNGSSATTTSDTVVKYSVTNPTGKVIHGLQFSAYLPHGVNVPVVEGTHNIVETNLVAGSALSGVQVLTFGTYSAPLLRVSLMVSDSASLQSGFVRGEIVKLICSRITGTSLSLADFTNANNGSPITDFVAYKYLGNNQNEEVSSFLTPTLNVTLN